MTRSNRQLIELIRKHDAGAFEEFFARHRVRLLARLVRTVRERSAAEDLLQETFLRVWTRAEQWDGRGDPERWLFRIATNLALNHIRSVRRRRSRPLDVPSVSADEDEEGPVPGWMVDAASLGPEALAEQAERSEKLHRLILDLPEEKREILELVYEEGMDIPSAADTLGIPEGTVKSRLFNVRKRLVRMWEETERRNR